MNLRILEKFESADYTEKEFKLKRKAKIKINNKKRKRFTLRDYRVNSLKQH